MYQTMGAQQTVPLELSNFEEPIDLSTFSTRRDFEIQKIQQSENVRQWINYFTNNAILFLDVFYKCF